MPCINVLDKRQATGKNLVPIFGLAGKGIPAPEVWLVSSPSQATKLTGMPLPVQFLQAGVTDSHGTWLVGTDGFYLYTDAGFQRAAPMPPRPDGNFAIAGACA